MGLKTYLSDAVNPLLKHYNYQIIKRDMLYGWQKTPQTQLSYNQSELPKGAMEYLQLNNPILQDLQARYAVFNNEATAPLAWTDTHVKPDDILYFRGDNAYVWQKVGGLNMGTISYALTTYYVKSIDHLRLLELLEEDEFFGIFTFRFDNRLISRIL